MRGEYKRIEWEKGLHAVNKHQVQLRFCTCHAKDLIEHFKDAVDATRDSIQIRTKPYKLCIGSTDDRVLNCRESKTGTNDHLPESFWEQGIWKGRAVFRDCTGLPFVDIQCYQVLLKREQRRKDEKTKNLGEIDLLGISPTGLPVVIELKTAPSQCLLFAMVEVLTYGIAIRKAWDDPKHLLRDQWAGVVKKAPVDNLGTLQLVCAGPMEYWRDTWMMGPSIKPAWKPQSGFCTELRKFQKMVKNIDGGGYEITFVSLEQNGLDDKGYPVISGARAIDLPSAP